MKSLTALTKRNFKEMFRDPLSLVFCIAFPLLMLLLMQIIFANFESIPANFKIENYASGICVFGYTFTSLYVALQISGDKNTSFIKRINIAPIKHSTYLFSYCISALAICLIQTILFFLVALCFGFPFGGMFFLSIVYLIPSSFFYISFGVFVGVICKNQQQTGPFTSIFISLTGIFAGIFMPIESFTGGFKKFINLLPFCHTTEIASQLFYTGAKCFYPHILYIIIYTVIIWLAILTINYAREKR